MLIKRENLGRPAAYIFLLTALFAVGNKKYEMVELRKRKLLIGVMYTCGKQENEDTDLSNNRQKLIQNTQKTGPKNEY